MRMRAEEIHAVVLGLVPPGLNVVRELGKAGVPVCGVAQKGLGEVGRYSRYLKRCIEYGDWNELLEKLVAFSAGQADRPVLIPTSDQYVFFIADHFTRLSRYFVFQNSYRPDQVAMTVDKRNLYQSLAVHGIPYPKTWFFDANNSAAPKPNATCYPVIAKPRLIHEKKAVMGSRKVCLIHSSDELAAFRDRFRGELADWMLQEIIPGPPSNLVMFLGYLDGNSRLRASFTCRKIRQFPRNFGVGSLLVSERIPEIVQLSVKYLRAIGYQGIGEIEFKFDHRDGVYKMMDLNPRPPLFASMAPAAGVRINVCAFDDMTGTSGNADDTTDQRENVCWRHLEFDLWARIRTALGRDREGADASVLEMPGRRKPSRGTSGPIWDATDMLPVFHLPLFHLRRKMRSRRARLAKSFAT